MPPLLLTIGSLTLRETSKFLMVLLIFEVGLYAIPTTDLLDTFTETLHVGYNNVTFGFNFLVAGWAPVMPWLLAPSEASLEGLLSLLSTLSKAHLGICIELVHP